MMKVAAAGLIPISPTIKVVPVVEIPDFGRITKLPADPRGTTARGVIVGVVVDVAVRVVVAVAVEFVIEVVVDAFLQEIITIDATSKTLNPNNTILFFTWFSPKILRCFIFAVPPRHFVIHMDGQVLSICTGFTRYVRDLSIKYLFIT
jgi:hypothetical protein